MVGSVRDRAVSLLQTLPPDAGVERILEALRALDGKAAAANPSEARPSEPRFRLIFESSGLGIAFVDIDGRLLVANRALARMLGYGEDELKGMTFSQITHPDDVALDYSLYEELLRGTRTHYQIEKRYLRKDGSIAWGRLTASLTTNEKDTNLFGIGMVEDITEIRRAREEEARLVRALNERVKELTTLHATARLLQDESLPSSILFTRVAASLPAAFQYPERTAARLTYGNLSTTTPGYRERGPRLCVPFRTIDEQCGSLEVVLDSEESAEQVFAPEDRRLLDSIAEMLRVTLDRRLAEQARRQSDERLHAALTATGLGSWEWDVSTDRMAWSEQMERLAGLEVGAFGGSFAAFTTLTHPDDRPLLHAAFQSALGDASRRDQCEVELRFQPRGERSRWVALKGRVLRDECGRPLKILGVGLDITSRRMLEDQLHQAQKMEAVGRLAGGVAHDFNNILTVIAGNCDLMLADMREKDPLHELVTEVREAADRAGGLTRQLLSFSRKNVIQPMVLDLRSSLRHLEAMLRRLIGEDIELVTEVAADTAHVRMDSGQLEQVLLNLAVNARDAMPAGGRLAIRIENAVLTASDSEAMPGLRPGAYVMLAVADSGHGMTPETLERIFEPFFTTKPPGKGTGLGLSVAFGIVKQGDGHIVAESEPGKGTTFRVYLPRVDTAARAANPEQQAQTMPRGNETVLVVEDEVMLRKIVRTVLLSQGYRVLDTSSGREAMLLARSAERVDLVLTDVVLPGMSGREVVEGVQELWPDVSVLFISGYADDALVREGVLRAEVGFLQKPFSPSILAHKVREVLDTRVPPDADRG